MYERRYHSEVTFVGGVVQGREAVAVIVVTSALARMFPVVLG